MCVGLKAICDGSFWRQAGRLSHTFWPQKQDAESCKMDSVSEIRWKSLSFVLSIDQDHQILDQLRGRPAWVCGPLFQGRAIRKAVVLLIRSTLSPISVVCSFSPCTSPKSRKSRITHNPGCPARLLRLRLMRPADVGSSFNPTISVTVHLLVGS